MRRPSTTPLNFLPQSSKIFPNIPLPKLPSRSKRFAFKTLCCSSSRNPSPSHPQIPNLISILRAVPDWADSIKERGMRKKRALYTHDNWLEHRSSLRHLRHVLSSLSSRVILSLIPPVFTFTIFAAVIAGYNYAVELKWLPEVFPLLRASSLPYQLTAPALALLLVFRTEASYSRFEEGRRAWTSVVAGTNELARQVMAAVESESDAEMKKALLQYIMAFPVALKNGPENGIDIIIMVGLQRNEYAECYGTLDFMGLVPNFDRKLIPLPLEGLVKRSLIVHRSQTEAIDQALHTANRPYAKHQGSTLIKRANYAWMLSLDCWAFLCHVIYGSDIGQDLRNVLEEDDLTVVLSSKHRPRCVIEFISQSLRLLHLDESRRSLLESKVACFHEGIGVCEQLMGIPIPLSYTRLTSRFLVLWHLTLPIILWDDCNWIVIPATFISAASLFCIEEVGVLIEEPFPMLALDELCKLIHDSIREAIAVEGLIQRRLRAKKRVHSSDECSANGWHSLGKD